MFVPGRLFHLSLIFVGMATSLPWSGELERCFTRVSSSLTGKHQTRLERPAMNKHTSLMGPLISRKENKVLRMHKNIKLSWETCQGQNALAYFAASSVTKRKKFSTSSTAPSSSPETSESKISNAFHETESVKIL